MRLLFCLLALTTALSHRLNSEIIESPYVTCEVKGGLGNQLFEIATTLAYAWDYGAHAVFPDLNPDNSSVRAPHRSFFFRLDSSVPARPFSTSYQEISWHSSEILPFRVDQKLIGYFQSWRRFDHYRDKLLELFAPSESAQSALEQKYGELLSHHNTVGVHVRTFARWLHVEKLHPFLGLEYYQKTMDLFPPDALFVIFSDRINWCKKHFAKFGKHCVFIESNDEIEDFYLMAMMKHQIMPHSTFSWWAAYLNRNPDKIVIAPDLRHPDFQAFLVVSPNEFYLPEWELISVDRLEPYPTDMTDYDSIPWDGN